MSKAVHFNSYGGIDVLEVREVPRPVPGAGEVLVEVKAAGINPSEAVIRSGALLQKWLHSERAVKRSLRESQFNLVHDGHGLLKNAPQKRKIARMTPGAINTSILGRLRPRPLGSKSIFTAHGCDIKTLSLLLD
jgi:hypothetical protein